MPTYYTTASGIHVPTSANNGTDVGLGLKQMGDDIDAMIVALSVKQRATQSVSVGLPNTSTWTDLTGLSITFTLAAAASVMVESAVQLSLTRTAGGAWEGASSVRLMVDTVANNQGSGVLMNSAGDVAQMVGTSIVTAHLTLAAGSHTIKVQGESESLVATNVTVDAQAGSLTIWS
jgi:hypothetical protein